MAAEIDFSIMADTADPPYKADLLRLLTQFESKERTRVNLTVVPWMEGWTQMVKVALYGHGPDVSEVGTTWVSSLVAMNALLAFSQRHIDGMGGAKAFLSPAWESVFMAGEPGTWAIPWLAGTRVIFYRRDLLEKAGVDESTAFQTHERLERTLESLQASNGSAPWIVPTHLTLNTLHYIASWVWGAGGHFLTPNGLQLGFHLPEARVGMGQYYRLSRFLHPLEDGLSDAQAYALFWGGQAAVTMGGHWVPLFQTAEAPPEVVENLGTAPVPGVPFVGGSNLVVWKHTRRTDTAVKLIRFLTSHQILAEYSPCTGLLPARLGTLDTPRFAEDPLFQVAAQSVLSGRSFRSLRLWGLVEEQLTSALSLVWTDVLANPQADIDALLGKHLEPLADRLQMSLTA